MSAASLLVSAAAEAPSLSSGRYVFVFTDIADSTRLTYSLPPAVWGPARDAFYALQARLARAMNRVWLSPRGDGKFLVFASEQEAVQFAAALLSAMGETDWGDVPMAIRIGIAAGEAEFLPTEENPVQSDFVGTPLNLAARICSAARPGEALVASDVYAEAGRRSAADLPDISYADLGEIELKGLPSERVYRIVAPGLRQDFPPLAQRGNLNQFRPHSAYFGSPETVAAALAALTEAQPVLTLLGDPGLGKTRLSLEIGRQASDLFLDGVWFVPLEHTRQGDLVAESVATGLGIAPQPGRDTAAILREHLKSRRALLILDNCEQLLTDEGDDGLLEFVEQTVRACPKVRLLATSRRPLELGPSLERMMRVSDLPVPPPHAERDLARLAAYPSVGLLCDRLILASAGRFALTAEAAPFVAAICRALDGVPLYLELAAGQLARGRTLPQIAADVYGMLQTRDRAFADRQRTLDKLLDFSFDQMPEERAFYFRLGVFAGTFRAEDAAAVCQEPNAEELLWRLVGSSLVKSDVENYLAEKPAYRLLQAPAAYGRKRLADELPRWQKRHADYYLAFAQECDSQIKGPEQKNAAERMAGALSNLRAGMDWAASAGEDRLAAAYGSALGRFLYNRGLTEEGPERLRTAAEAARRASDAPALACLLSWRATFERQRGDKGAARRLEEEALPLWRESGDPSGEAASLYGLALVQDGMDAQRSLLDQALALYRTWADRWGEANCLHNLGIIAQKGGRTHGAQSLYAQALALRREIGDLRGIGNSLAYLGILASSQSDYATARRYYEQAIVIKRDLAEQSNAAWGLYALGHIAQSLGEREQAQALYTQALTVYQTLGLQAKEAVCCQRLADLAIDHREAAAARRYGEQALYLFTGLADLRGTATALARLSGAALLDGNLAEAERLATEALEIERAQGVADSIASSLNHLGRIAQAKGDLRAARRYFAESLQMLDSLKNAHGVAMVLTSLGEIAAAAGESAMACRCAGAACQIFADLALPETHADCQKARLLWNCLAEPPEAVRSESVVQAALAWAAA